MTRQFSMENDYRNAPHPSIVKSGYISINFKDCLFLLGAP